MQKRHSQLWQSSWNWSCGGLTSVVLIVLGTVNFQLTHWKRPWCWKRLRAGGEVDDGGWDDWMASSTQRTWVWVDSELVMDREAWRAAVRRVTKSWTRLSGWTELNWTEIFGFRVALFPFPWGQFLELWQLMSWLQSGHHEVNFFHLVGFQCL